MKSLSAARRRVRASKLVLVIGALAVTAALAPVAVAQLAAGATKASLNVPLPASARILSSASNSLEVCYDHPIATVVQPTYFSALGYDVNREDPAMSAVKSTSSADCVVVQFANGSNSAPLTDFTRVSVSGGAVTGTNGATSLGGGLALDGTAQAPRPGNTAGPDLVGTPSVTTQGTNRVISYRFDQALDSAPGTVPPGVYNAPTNITDAFGYYTSSGTVVTCGGLNPVASPGVSISGDTVSCRIPSSTYAAAPASRFFVLGSAVRDRPTQYSCCDVNPIGSAGGSAGRPVITAFSQTGPSTGVVTYNEPVTVRDGGQFQLYSSDGSSTPPVSATQGSNPSQVVLNFPASLANAAYKVVGIGDPGAGGRSGGAVQGRGSGTPQSATSYLAIKTAPIEAGRVDGPDLQTVTVNKTASTATFVFRGLVASISSAHGADGVGGFRLVDVSGNITSGTGVLGIINDSPRGLDPTSRVTVSFPSAAVLSARAAQILDGDVVDFQGKVGLRNTVAISNLGSQLFGHTAFVSPGGVAGVFAGCFAPSGCGSSLTIRATTGTHPVIGKRSFGLGYDNGGIVHVSLTSNGQKLLKSSKTGQLAVTATVSDSSGTHTTSLNLVRFITTGRGVNPDVTGTGVLRTFGRTAFASGGAVSGVFLGCFFTGTCSGSMSVNVGSSQVGVRHFLAVGAANGGIVHVTLSSSARKTLDKNGTLVIRVTVNGPLGGTQSTTLRLVRFS